MQSQKRQQLKAIVSEVAAELSLEASHLFRLEREFKKVSPVTDNERISFFIIASASNILAEKLESNVEPTAVIENYQHFFSSILTVIDSIGSIQLTARLSEIVEMVSERSIVN